MPLPLTVQASGLVMAGTTHEEPDPASAADDPASAPASTTSAHPYFFFHRSKVSAHPFPPPPLPPPPPPTGLSSVFQRALPPSSTGGPTASTRPVPTDTRPGGDSARLQPCLAAHGAHAGGAKMQSELAGGMPPLVGADREPVGRWAAAALAAAGAGASAAPGTKLRFRAPPALVGGWARPYFRVAQPIVEAWRDELEVSARVRERRRQRVPFLHHGT